MKKRVVKFRGLVKVVRQAVKESHDNITNKTVFTWIQINRSDLIDRGLTLSSVKSSLSWLVANHELIRAADGSYFKKRKVLSNAKFGHIRPTDVEQAKLPFKPKPFKYGIEGRLIDVRLVNGEIYATFATKEIKPVY